MTRPLPLRLVALAVLILAGCLKNNATHDPIEPVMMALTNTTDHVVYLDTLPGGDILGAGLRLQQKGASAYLIPAPSCAERLCSEACEVVGCTDAPSVRELLPNATYSFAWMPYEFSPGQDTCPGQACLAAARAPEGRYLMSACYGTDLKMVGTPQKSPTDPLVISGASVSSAICTKPFEVGLPGYDVRYQLYIP